MFPSKESPGVSGGPQPECGGNAELVRLVSLVQGIYYLFTGIWPLVSIGTFQKVTGPKTDLWLVRTVGVVVGVIGAVLAVGGARRQTAVELPLLAVGSAAGLAAIDIVYVAKRRIAPIYLLDALAEVILIGGWILAWLRRPLDASGLQQDRE